jgi:TP901 family phage tail tape measure protein
MMGSKLAELFVEITARDTSLQSALNRIQTQVGRTASMLKGFAGVAAGALAAGAVAGGMDRVVSSAIDLESRLSQLRKTTGLEGESLGKLHSQLNDLSRTMAGTKIDELFDIATMGGRLGVASNKIAGFTRDIAMVRIALDDIPAEEAATSIARILNVFGKGTEDAIRFASALNKLDDSSTATGRDILDITQRLSGPASTLGLSPQKVLALAAALKDSGAENEVAGTAIGQVFGKMATHAQAFAQVAGVSVKQFTATLKRDPLAALTTFSAGLKKLGAIQQFEALDKLGLDGQRTATTLMQLGRVTDKLSGYVRTANSEWRSLASIMAENAVQSGTTASHLARMQNIIKATTDKLVMLFLPVVKAAADSVSDLTGDIGGFIDRTKGSIEAFASRMALGVRWVGLAFSEWRTILSLAKVTVQEKMEQIGAIVGGVGVRMWDQVKWAGKAALTYLKNIFKGYAYFLADMFTQVGASVAAQIQNALAAVKLPKLLGGGSLASKVAVPAITPHVELLGDPTKDIKERPGFDRKGLFDALPDRSKEKGALVDRLNQILQNKRMAAARDAFKNRPDIQANLNALPGAVKGVVNPREETARERLAQQNKERGFPAFKGTERQAAGILRAREVRRAREEAMTEKRLQDRQQKRGAGPASFFGQMAGATAENFGAKEGMQRLAATLVGGLVGGLPGAFAGFRDISRNQQAITKQERANMPKGAGDAKKGDGKVMDKVSTTLSKLDGTLAALTEQMKKPPRSAPAVFA